jgi:hypothetical protein
LYFDSLIPPEAVDVNFIKPFRENYMSEFGPSPAEDAEKEAVGVSLASEIAELRSRARTDDDFQVVLDKIKELEELFRAESPESKVTIEQAKEIFGATDFLGPDEVKAAFLGQVEISEVPQIPFSPEELEKAQKLGQMLVLRVDKATDGSPLTMLKIHQILNDRLEADDRGKVLRSKDDDWKMKSAFYTKESATSGWALVSKEVLGYKDGEPDEDKTKVSTEKNYLQQTEILVNYLKNEVFAERPLPEEYQSAIDEFEREKAGIVAIIKSDWEDAAEKLEALQINQLIRQTPVEALYDLMVRYQQTDERLLPDKYTWTNRRYSVGSLVFVGYFKSDGVGVRWAGPGYVRSDLGVSFSRSQ